MAQGSKLLVLFGEKIDYNFLEVSNVYDFTLNGETEF